MSSLTPSSQMTLNYNLALDALTILQELVQITGAYSTQMAIAAAAVNARAELWPDERYGSRFQAKRTTRQDLINALWITGDVVLSEEESSRIRDLVPSIDDENPDGAFFRLQLSQVLEVIAGLSRHLGLGKQSGGDRTHRAAGEHEQSEEAEVDEILAMIPAVPSVSDVFKRYSGKLRAA